MYDLSDFGIFLIECAIGKIVKCLKPYTPYIRRPSRRSHDERRAPFSGAQQKWFDRFDLAARMILLRFAKRTAKERGSPLGGVHDNNFVAGSVGRCVCGVFG